MTDAVATALLSVAPFPLGTVAGPVLFELVGEDGTVVATQSATSSDSDTQAAASFAAVAAGTYSIRVTRLDGSGSALATPVASDSFVVSAPATVSITVPGSVSVALS